MFFQHLCWPFHFRHQVCRYINCNTLLFRFIESDTLEDVWYSDQHSLLLNHFVSFCVNNKRYIFIQWAGNQLQNMKLDVLFKVPVESSMVIIWAMKLPVIFQLIRLISLNLKDLNILITQYLLCNKIKTQCSTDNIVNTFIYSFSSIHNMSQLSLPL